MSLLRSLLLGLSRSTTLRDFIIGFSISRRMSRRFVAGETLEEAIEAINSLNQRGILATIDHLGENVASKEEARQAAEEYLRALDGLAESGVDSGVSLKLTQMGLDIDRSFCQGNVAQIVEKARRFGIFVQIDMEGSPHTERTIQVYRALRQRYDNVGIAIQSYLYRSEDDVRQMIPQGLNVRLCKGAYDEPPDIAFPDKRDVDANLIKLMEMLLTEEARKAGCYPALATHDEKIIDWCKEHVRKEGIGKEEFEFQMLYGIRSQLQQELADQGYRVRAYVPYGNSWYPYFMRRLAERPANLLFLLGNLFKA